MPGGSKTTTVQSNQPAAWAAPHLTDIASEAKTLYDSGSGFTPYQGSTVVPFSQQTQTALTGMENLANQGAPLVNQASSSVQGLLSNGGFNSTQQGALNQLQGTASGGYLGPNEYLNKYLDDASNKTANNVNMQFSMGGRYGSGAHTQALANEIGTLRNNAMMQNYATERQNQLAAQNGILGAGTQANAQLMQAAGMTPELYQASYLPSQMLAQVGSQYEDLSQKQLQSDIDKYYADQQQPFQQLQAYADMINGVSNKYGTTTQAQKGGGQSTLQTLLGAGLLGAGLFL